MCQKISILCHHICLMCIADLKVEQLVVTVLVSYLSKALDSILITTKPNMVKAYFPVANNSTVKFDNNLKVKFNNNTAKWYDGPPYSNLNYDVKFDDNGIVTCTGPHAFPICIHEQCFCKNIDHALKS